MNDTEMFEFLYLETIDILKQYGCLDSIKKSYGDSIIYRPILFQILSFFVYSFGNLHNRIPNLINSKGERGTAILFQGVKYMDIINELTKINKIQVLVWEGIRSFIVHKHDFHKVVVPPLIPIGYRTLNNIRELDNKKLSSLINQLNNNMEKIKRVLLKYSPDAIVLRTDSFPIDRAVILVAKELGIPTINLQDGIYQSQLPLIHGRAADYVFVWGEYFKHLYSKQKIRPSKTMKILGYPYKLKSLPQRHKKQKLTVYYLGQAYEVCNKDFLEIKVNTVNTLNNICKNYGFEFIYRPHPGDPRELLQRKLPNVKFAPKNETLDDSFQKGDIFISFNSTALVEAALHGRLCIQLKDYPVPTDDFEKLGICPKSFDTVEDLESYLKEIAKVKDLEQFYKPVNPEYIEIPKPNPGAKFLELIRDII